MMSLDPGQSDLIENDTDFSYRAFTPGEIQHFRKNDWVFINAFLSTDHHDYLLKSWPPKFHFRPIHQIHKLYDNGLIDNAHTFARYPGLKHANDYFSSPAFADLISTLCCDGRTRKFDRVILGRAFSGSRLAPHLDQVAKNTDRDHEINHSLNLILFVQGTGGPNAGGTCILKENDLGNVIFEPTSLNNSLLIYKSGLIYHGFPKMRPRTFRRTLIFNMLTS